MFNNIRLAFSFLTIFPITVDTKDKKCSLSQSMIYFPVVGLFIALISLSMINVIEPVTSFRFTSLLLILLPIIISGGLHIDGLADFFDAFFQGKDRNDILSVMKDSRIGVWGALSVVFIILLKWELLMTISSRSLGFVFALCVSRWAHVFICFLLPYARKEDGLGKNVAGKISLKELLISTTFVVIIGLFLSFKSIIILILCSLFIYFLSLFFKKKINGITGDVIGATGEMSELFTLLCIVVMKC